MEQRANVIMMQGKGEQKIVDAIMQGAINGKFLEEMEQVKRENEELRSRNAALVKDIEWWKNMAGILHRSNDKMQRVNLARYDHDLRKRRRRREAVDWFSAAGVTLGICLALTALSIAIIVAG